MEQLNLFEVAPQAQVAVEPWAEARTYDANRTGLKLTLWEPPDRPKPPAGSRGDCVTRAFVAATGLPYAIAWQLLDGTMEHHRTCYQAHVEKIKAAGRRPTPRFLKEAMKDPFDGVRVSQIKEALKAIGWTYVDGTRKWEKGQPRPPATTYHRMTARRLPPGRSMVVLCKHVAAVVDGLVIDTYDSRGKRGVTLEGIAVPCPDLMPNGPDPGLHCLMPSAEALALGRTPAQVLGKRSSHRPSRGRDGILRVPGRPGAPSLSEPWQTSSPPLPTWRRSCCTTSRHVCSTPQRSRS
jgi:hypothetical protein